MTRAKLGGLVIVLAGCAPDLVVGACRPLQDEGPRPPAAREPDEGFWCEVRTGDDALVVVKAGEVVVERVQAPSTLSFTYAELPDGARRLLVEATTDGVFGGRATATLDVPDVLWVQHTVDREPLAVVVRVRTSAQNEVRLGGVPMEAQGRTRERSLAPIDLLGDEAPEVLVRREARKTLPLVVRDRAGRDREVAIAIDATGDARSLRSALEGIASRGVPWGAPPSDRGASPTVALVLAQDGSVARVTTYAGARHLRDAAWVAHVTETLERRSECGPYYGMRSFWVPRLRRTQQIAVYEARTGRHLGTRSFRGGEPGSCSPTYVLEQHEPNPTILGSEPVEAIERWLPTLGG